MEKQARDLVHNVINDDLDDLVANGGVTHPDDMLQQKVQSLQDIVTAMLAGLTRPRFDDVVKTLSQR